MIDEEKEYKRIFYFLKRWSKHWLTPSARSYELREPARKALEFILSLDDSNTFKKKLLLLRAFLGEQDEKEKNIQFMGTGFYRDNISYIRRAISSIENGESPKIRKI